MDLTQFVASGVSTWDVAFAVLSVLGGWLVAHVARRGVVAVARRVPDLSDAVGRVAARLVYYLILLLGVGIALAFLGANVQPLLGIVIIAVVVAVLVLRGVADNFAAGVLIQARQTVRLGDEIAVEGSDGTIIGVVTDLNSRSVLLRTADGRTVHMPNARLLSEPIVNHSTLGMRRGTVEVRLARASGAPVADAATVAALAAGAAGVLPEPAPRALVTTVSAERIILSVGFWHPPREGAAVTAAVVEVIASGLETAGRDGTVTSTLAPPALTPSDAV